MKWRIEFILSNEKTKYSLIIFRIITIILHLISFNFFPINYEFTFQKELNF